MADPSLLVPVEKVATWLGLDPAELTNVQTEIIGDAILDAQTKVGEYLNRPLEPTSVTRTGLYRDEAYDADDVRAWPIVTFDDTYTVGAVVANTDDPTLWDVTFLVGLPDEARTAIVRFVRQDAIEHLTSSPALPQVKRKVKSVSAEGQSVSYESAAGSPDAAGGALTVTVLRRWKRFSVGRATPPPDRRPWPYRA